MKDKIDLMDKAIKEKFAHHEVPVPSILWNSIESKLPVENNSIFRKSFFKNPFAISLLIVSTSLVGAYLYHASTPKNNLLNKKEANISSISNEQQHTTKHISTYPSKEIEITHANKINLSKSFISSSKSNNNSGNTTVIYKNSNRNLIKNKSIPKEKNAYLNNKNPLNKIKKATTRTNNVTATSYSDKTKHPTVHSKSRNQKSNNDANPNAAYTTSKQLKKIQGAPNNSTNKKITSADLNTILPNNNIKTRVYSDSTTQSNSTLNNITSLSELNNKSTNNDKALAYSNTHKIDTSNSLSSNNFNDNQMNSNATYNKKSTLDTTELNYSTDSNTLLTKNNTTGSTKPMHVSADPTIQDPILNNTNSTTNFIEKSINNDETLISGKTRNNDSLNSLSNINKIDNNVPLNQKSIDDTTALYTKNISETELKLNSATSQAVSSHSNVDSLSKNNIVAHSIRLEKDIQSHSNAITEADSLQLKIDSTIIAKEIDSTYIANATKSANELKIEDKKKYNFLSRCSIDGYGTPSLTYMHLSPNTGTEQQNSFINERNKNAKPGFGITTGLRINYRLTKKVEIGIGIQYSILQQQSSFQNSQFDHISTSYKGYNRIDTIYDSIRNIKSYSKKFIITDSTKKAIYSTGLVKHTDKFQNINIPIHVAYGYSISEKFSLIARTSLLINIQTYSVTYIKESDSTIVSQHSAKNISLGGSFSVGGYYLLSRKCTAFIEPIITYYFSNVFDKQVPFKQTQYQLGLQTGIRISF